ncbi:MAG: FAD-dependent oxidoreductase [Sulfuriferula sp.]
MTDQTYDAIIIGSGAGGSAAAYVLVNTGCRVLLLEKGGHLPRDGSTLDVARVFKADQFKSKEVWLDKQYQHLVPEEFYNVGGKTKWYGAALLRFAAHEFEADPDFQCLGWPIDYTELEPYYAQAESLLKVNHFANEPQLQRLIDRIVKCDPGWQSQALPLGLKRAILQHPEESKHFDGFASPGGYKGDAEMNLLNPLMRSNRLTLHTHKEVTALLAADQSPLHIIGVHCADGSTYHASSVIMAAGAMSSPRLLQQHLEQTELQRTWPAAALVGANFKLHLNSALLAFSPFVNQDVLRKTAVFFNDAFPHSTVQCLGWLDGEILATQLPATVPRFAANILGARAYGFFVTTEDGSSIHNRIVSRNAVDEFPMIDYSLERIPASVAEHESLLKAFKARLLRAGLLSVGKPMGLTGTAHALGSLVTGHDPATSVVDAHGKVHGFEGLYVADGSVLPRSSRVNPGLTIYAWGLRLGNYLAENKARRPANNA